MANIHAMYGVMSELHANAEEARAFLFQTLADVKNGKIDLAQLEFPTTGGIRIIPPSELPPAPEPEDDTETDAVKGTGEPEAE